MLQGRCRPRTQWEAASRRLSRLFNDKALTTDPRSPLSTIVDPGDCGTYGKHVVSDQAGATMALSRFHWDKISRSRHIRGVTLPRVQPIIPTRRKEPFDDPDWLFEFKYDGFRALCYLDQGRCRFISRNGNLLTGFHALADQVAAVLER